MPTDDIDPLRAQRPSLLQPTPAPAPRDPSAETIGPDGSLWLVPVQRNPNFTGRDQLLEEIAQYWVKHAGRTVPPLALVGPEGVGKTQLAAEFAHRNRGKHSTVWWLRAGSDVTLDADCAALVRALRPESADQDVRSMRGTMRELLAGRSGWVLIFDGANDPARVADCLPAGRHEGRVLVTSREAGWRKSAAVLPVGPFERAESMHFLRERSGRGQQDGVLAVGQLAKALGDLPLALEYAASLIAQGKIGFDDYLRRLERYWAELLQRGVDGAAAAAGSHAYAITLSLELSIRQLESAAPASAELLNLLAFVAPEPFQKTWLMVSPEQLGPTLGPTVTSGAFLEEAFGALQRLSLIEARAGAISLRGVVGRAVRDRMSHEARTEWAHRALRLMDAAFRFDAGDPRTWATSAAMLPHALAAVDHAGQTDVTVAAAASLLNQVGQCLFRTARYEQARLALDRALAIAYRIYGEENPRVSAITNNLGRVLLRLGDLPGARQALEWALHLDERTYGPTHPHVAEVLNNLGLCQVRLDDYEAARLAFERALGIYEYQFGPSHQNVASILNNIGYLKLVGNDLDGAWEMLQRALGAAHGAYGPNHPDVASILLNLGDVLHRQGSHAAARAQYNRALVIDEIAYGPNHPDVARDLAHLGDLEFATGEYAAARRHLERALAIDEAVYGAKHPNLGPRLNDLGRCLKALNEVDAAVACFTRAAALPKRSEAPAAA